MPSLDMTWFFVAFMNFFLVMGAFLSFIFFVVGLASITESLWRFIKTKWGKAKNQ